MALERACLPRQVEKSSIKGELREGPGFLFKTIILAEKLNFDLVFSSPTTSEDKFFTVFYAPNKRPTSRIGISVAKRAVNKATKRNRLKRLIKSSFLSSFKCESGTDVVVKVKHQASRVANDKILRESLVNHWQEIMNHPTTKSRASG